ncbi:MAG: ribonuclease H-like domain-containing protein [Ferruginibacter sp.]
MDLYLDAEWFIGGDIFLLGWSRNTKVWGQLYEDTLTEERFQDLLDDTDGKIFFYGPDIGIIEKYFDIDIRSNYHCVNLLKVFKDNLPDMPNYKLATIEKYYHIKRNRQEYKANIFSIFQDWRKPQVRSLVLQYNREDVINLARLKNIIFAQFDIEEEYLLQVKLAGLLQIKKDFAFLLPCDVYRGRSFGKYKGDGSINNPNITAQLVVQAKFYNDKISLYRMIVLMHDVVKDNDYDLITCVNNRDSIFHMARALAKGIASKCNIPFLELIHDHNTKADSIIKGKRILVVDDVIYKGTTMNKAIDACSQQKPALVHFLAFGKSSRFAY